MKLLFPLYMSLSFFCFADENATVTDSMKNPTLHHMSVKEKKKRFLKLLLPAVQKVHDGLMQRYKRIKKNLENNINIQEIEFLKKIYRATSDEDLLARLKPHPISITLAQAAMESSWATSRFFKDANNVFGMWSSHLYEKRIAADGKRASKTVWLKKFDTIEEAIRAYYEMIATGKAYNKFRQLRLQYDDPYKITEGLDKYSEMGSDYVKVINQVIKYNNFTKFDKKESY